MSAFVGATAIAPMVPPKYLSVVEAHDWPPSVVLKTPAPVVPIQYSIGRATEPATAALLPPRKGPSSRHLRVLTASVSSSTAERSSGDVRLGRPSLGRGEGRICATSA